MLKQIHDDLDAAVFEAYGWPVTLTDEEILERLVALNAERAEEEKRGLIRWLRPEFQNPTGGRTIQPELDIEPEEDAADTGPKPKKAAAVKKTTWPKKLPEQFQIVVQRLQTAGQPLTAADLAKAFTSAKEADIAELLDTLVTLGKARPVKGDRYAAV